MKRQFILGIDLAKDSFVTTLLNAEGNPCWQATAFPNSTQGYLQLIDQLPEPKQTLVVLESTGVYGKPCLQAICTQMLAVYEVNPLIIKRLSTSMVRRNRGAAPQGRGAE